MKSESHSIPWVSGRPRYDKTTQLPKTQEMRRERVFVSWNGEEGGFI